MLGAHSTTLALDNNYWAAAPAFGMRQICARNGSHSFRGNLAAGLAADPTMHSLDEEMLLHAFRIDSTHPAVLRCRHTLSPKLR